MKPQRAMTHPGRIDRIEDAGAAAAQREVRSEDLFGGSRVVLIRHADAVYTLRRTSNGKLILTK
jgi:hemin uptake protein HemP